MSNINQKAISQIKNDIAMQWSWLQLEEIEQCYNYALSDYLRLTYPSENNRPNSEDLVYDFTCTNWLSARMRDILSRAGGLSASAYRENGINITYGASYIDPQLVSMIMPKAGVPR